MKNVGENEEKNQKMIKIEFELKDKQNILIFGVDEDGIRKNVGCIFTPSSSAHNIKNAIQICGISEVFEIFDYWGCSRYIQPKDLNNTPKRIIDALENKKEKFIQMKDIQIMFDFGTEPSDYKKRDLNLDRDCLGCFNNPCTCDNKGSHKHISPYNVKRETDLEKENRLEYSEGSGIIHGKEKEDLLKKLEDKK